MTLLFTDIHFGVRQNTEVLINICRKSLKWIEEVVAAKKVDRIIFCGDYFHNRSSVSVHTYNKAYDALVSLASTVKDVYMIVGNHDSFYKNSIDINSIKAFEQIDNVHVISELTTVQLGKLKACLAPWGTELSAIKATNSDVTFGHFEPGGVIVVGGRLLDNGPYTVNELNDACKLVFSGHYHSRNEIKTKNGNTIFIGSTTQLNWGDVGEARGVYLFDESNKSYSFIENTVTPKFINLLYTADEFNYDKDSIKGNFIKLTINSDYKFEDVQQVVKELQQLNALTVEVEYLFYNQINRGNIEGTIANEIKTHEDYIRSFVMDTDVEFPPGVDRRKLLALALNVYKNSQEEQ